MKVIIKKLARRIIIDGEVDIELHPAEHKAIIRNGVWVRAFLYESIEELEEKITFDLGEKNDFPEKPEIAPGAVLLPGNMLVMVTGPAPASSGPILGRSN